MQRAMLFSSRAAGHSGIYLQQMVWHLEGGVDESRLRDAWASAVQCFDVLRSSFSWTDAGIHVQVGDTALDWSGPPQSGPSLEEYLRADSERGFTFDGSALSRVALLGAAGNGALVWTYHHALLDGFSRRRIMEFVLDTYDGVPVTAPTGEGVLALAQAISALPSKHQEETFWRSALDGWAGPTVLPIAVPESTGVGTGSVDHLETHLTLSLKDTQALCALALEIGVSPNTLVLGAWGLLLSHYSAEERVSFGLTRGSRRGLPGQLAKTAGLAINTTPFQMVVRPDEDLVSWLRGIRQEIRSSQPFEMTEASQIHEWSGLAEGRRLFETAVVLNRYHSADPNHGDPSVWENRAFDLIERTDVPLLLQSYFEERLWFKLEYHRNRHTPEATKRLLVHLESILKAFLSVEPGATLGEIAVIEAHERDLVLAEWNRTETPPPSYHTVSSLLMDRFRDHSSAVALVQGESSLTFGELAERSQEIATQLTSMGVGRSDLVGVMQGRSLDMVASLIAVLRIGAAYVPLDPSYPQKRIAHMVEDSGLKCVVTESAFRSQVPSAVRVLLVDLPTSGGGVESIGFPHAGPSDTAYVIYTSGSTGKPKGVCVSHENLLNFFMGMDDRVSGGPGDVWLAVTSISFDISALELLWTLSRGFTVVVHGGRQGAAPSSEGFTSIPVCIVEKGVTHLQCTPSLVSLLVDEEGALNALGQLDHLLLGGEALPLDLARRLLNAGVSTLLNMYGPTETTIWSSAWVVDPNASVVRIGEPISNTRFYVLDNRGRPLPIGIPGELHIGGAGVVRGYLDRPELTEARFWPSPFVEGDRLFRTGDLVRRMADGGVEFLGRLDHQVKIQGHRIELGEIEVHLRSHPGVHNAAVVPQRHQQGQMELKAFYVPTADGEASPAELLSYLSRCLPKPMVPRRLMSLTLLPRTPNGKIDRGALSAVACPSVGDPVSTAVWEAMSATERQVFKVWREVLGVPEIGLHENFFDLGGNSISAASVTHEIRQAIGVGFPLQCLFMAPSIALMALEIEKILVQQVDAEDLDTLLQEIEGLTQDQISTQLSDVFDTNPERGTPA